jgi:hypothetical protein
MSISGIGQLAPNVPAMLTPGEVVLNREKPRAIADACAQAKCDYCGRFGQLGSCEGCGAPNKPIQTIDVTSLSDAAPRYYRPRHRQIWR